jgi:hypothetical protein
VELVDPPYDVPDVVLCLLEDVELRLRGVELLVAGLIRPRSGEDLLADWIAPPLSDVLLLSDTLLPLLLPRSETLLL